MKNITLYTTLGCHLCEHAKEILFPISTEMNYKIIEIDIADSEELVERYGVSIPVIALNGNELFWPFDSNQVRGFLI